MRLRFLQLFPGDDVEESSNNLSIKSIGLTPDTGELEDIYAKVEKNTLIRYNV